MLRFGGISALGGDQFFGKQLLDTLMFAFGAYIIGLGLLKGTVGGIHLEIQLLALDFHEELSDADAIAKID